jgi:hypothetical protein
VVSDFKGRTEAYSVADWDVRGRYCGQIWDIKRKEKFEFRRGHDLYISPNISLVVKCGAERVARVGDERYIQAYGGEMQQMNRVGRPMRKLEDNIKRDLADISWDGMHCSNPFEDRGTYRVAVNTVMNIWVP